MRGFHKDCSAYWSRFILVVMCWTSNFGLNRGGFAWVWGVCHLVFLCNGRLFRTSSRFSEALYTVKHDSREISN